jgi:hypothetical protein
MPNIEKFDSSPEFFIENNHARSSIRKSAQIIGVSHPSVINWIGNLEDTTLAESLRTKGFDGGSLNNLVGYYATSKAVSQEVRDNCVQLLIKSSQKGFQQLLDEMAGLNTDTLLQITSEGLEDFLTHLADKIFAPRLEKIEKYEKACEEHDGAGYVIKSNVSKKTYPSEAVTAYEYCALKKLDKRYWRTFSRRYAQFVRVGTTQSPPKRNGKLLIYGELYYYAEIALANVMEII